MTSKTAGRRKEINEQTVRKTFNLTISQSSWIYEEAERQNISDSKLIRRILDQLIPPSTQDEDRVKQGA